MPKATGPDAAEAVSQATEVAQQAAEKSAKDTSTVVNFQKRFQEGYVDYLANLQSAHVNLQKRYGQSLSSYTERLQNDLGKALPEDTYRNYIQALQEAWGRPDAATRMADAYRRYVSALQEAYVAVQKAYEEGNRQLAEDLQQAWTEAQKEARDKQRDYVQSLQDTWSQANAEGMDPNTLAAIGGTIMAAAAAAGTVGQRAS